MSEPTVIGNLASVLTIVIRAVVLPGLLGALVWVTWRLCRPRSGASAHGMEAPHE